MDTGKAIRINEFCGPQVLEIVEVERPVPAAEEILVKVYAASVNSADYIIHPGGKERLNPFLKLPLGLDLDSAGIVEDVGSGVTTFKKGDKVYGVTNFLEGGNTWFLTAKANQFALGQRLFEISKSEINNVMDREPLKYFYNRFAFLTEKHGCNKSNEITDGQSFSIEYVSNTFIIRIEQYWQEFYVTLYKP